MRTIRVIAGFLALAFVFGPALLWAGGVRPEAFENKQLAPRPSPGDGWKAFDAAGPWATDHLPGRVDAVHANSWIDYFVLGTLPGGSSTTSVASSAGAGSSRDKPDKPVTPTVIRGKNGYLFLGEDFDSACDDGRDFRVGVRTLAHLARVIEASGRTVRFAIGPNKSGVALDKLPRALPRGDCATAGIRAENKVLDSFEDPNYVTARSALERESRSGHQVFWKTDTHWSLAGAAMYAQELAASLSPDVAHHVRVTHPDLTRTGDLTELAGLTFKETARSAVLETGGTVRETPRSDAYDPTEAHYGVNTWDTRPTGHVIPGRTVLIGDSFTYFALGALRPLFAHGTFLWTGRVPTQRLFDEIERSDTVVLEVVQRTTSHAYLTTPRIERVLAQILKRTLTPR